MARVKSAIDFDTSNLDAVGRSYYCFLLETAYTSIVQAEALMSAPHSGRAATGHNADVVTNHELPRIRRLIAEALAAS